MRRYPESGPERRAREEYYDRSYGAGRRELERCQSCNALFSSSDIAKGLNVRNRSVSSGSPGAGIPVRTSDSGGTCSGCLSGQQPGNDNKFSEFGGWQERQYVSKVHGGTGYYWERSDGLRLSQRTAGPYYPAGVGPRRGRPPRFFYWDELPGGGSAHPEGGWGGIGDAGSFHEHLEAEMNTRYEGEHVRFIYKDTLMDSIGEEVYPAEWKHESRLSVQQMAAWAEKRWPVGKTAKWPTLGVPVELS